MSKERERQILEILARQKQASVHDLAQRLYASEPSIRRDLARLHSQHLIQRTHGGAVLEETALSQTKIPFLIRELEQSDAKLIMARRAIEQVKDNDVVFLDASTSAYTLIPFLSQKRGITVVTNGVKALARLAEYGISTLSTGGELIASCMALVGEDACRYVDGINADVAFFSCRGLSMDGRLSDIAPAENHVRRRMIAQSRRAFLLCASEKFGKVFYHHLCTTRELDGVISDAETDAFPLRQG